MTYRAERAHVIPTFHYPPSPPTSANKPSKLAHDYDDMVTPSSSKRPSHNLLSNIVPSTSTSSSERSSRHSGKPFGSFGFDTPLDRRTTLFRSIQSHLKRLCTLKTNNRSMKMKIEIMLTINSIIFVRQRQVSAFYRLVMIIMIFSQLLSDMI